MTQREPIQNSLIGNPPVGAQEAILTDQGISSQSVTRLPYPSDYVSKISGFQVIQIIKITASDGLDKMYFEGDPLEHSIHNLVGVHTQRAFSMLSHTYFDLSSITVRLIPVTPPNIRGKLEIRTGPGVIIYNQTQATSFNVKNMSKMDRIIWDYSNGEPIEFDMKVPAFVDGRLTREDVNKSYNFSGLTPVFQNAKFQKTYPTFKSGIFNIRNYSEYKPGSVFADTIDLIILTRWNNPLFGQYRSPIRDHTVNIITTIKK